jgi:hypothetical protein
MTTMPAATPATKIPMMMAMAAMDASLPGSKEQATLIQIQDRDCEDMTRPRLMDALGGNQSRATITP